MSRSVNTCFTSVFDKTKLSLVANYWKSSRICWRTESLKGVFFNRTTNTFLWFLLYLKWKQSIEIEPELLTSDTSAICQRQERNTNSFGYLECKVYFIQEMSTLDVALVVQICLSLRYPGSQGFFLLLNADRNDKAKSYSKNKREDSLQKWEFFIDTRRQGLSLMSLFLSSDDTSLPIEVSSLWFIDETLLQWGMS